MHTPDYKYEVPDKTPVEMPLGYERPESLESMIARMVRVHSQIAEKHGAESFEEADDFDTDDDVELVSPYQLTDMQEETPSGYHLKSNDQKRRASDRTEASAQPTEKGTQSLAQKSPQETPKQPVEAQNVQAQ